MEDKDGNLLYRQGNAIKLHLKSEPHPRKIGNINEAEKFLHIVRDSTIHLFHKINGYGFNYTVLNSAKLFTHIKLEIKDKKRIYLIPLVEILSQGKFMNFKNEGFELQIFLSLTIIEQFTLIN